MKIELEVVNTGQISDGYHTFDELYEHRCLLFINLCLLQSHRCAYKLSGGGWFILFMETSQGQLSYHCPDRMLPFVEDVIIYDPEYSWDGHTSNDVANRLVAVAKSDSSFLKQIKAPRSDPQREAELIEKWVNEPGDYDQKVKEGLEKLKD